MIIQSLEESVEINYDELATLKQLARNGAMNREIKVSSGSLAETLDVSKQTVSRRLQNLTDAGFIYRQPISDGQYLFIRKPGKKALWNEYQEYQDIFTAEQDIILSGTVVEGMGKGKQFISLDGYQEKFKEQLSYEPFAGTLNVELDTESVRTRNRLTELEPTRIRGWEDEDESYGPVYCYPAKLEADTRIYKPVHVIEPERTQHDDDQLELLADTKLRTELNIESGDEVTIYVNRD
jgi:riboflavin kinase